MNKYLKTFLHRGLIFGGFGPVITAIIFYVLSFTLPDFSLGGKQILIATLSTYLLAFVHAGTSIFNQMEHWPLAKSLGCHFATLYVAYSLCYIVNSWIPFEPMVLIIFTAVFAAIYAAVWITVFLCVRAVRNRLNAKL